MFPFAFGILRENSINVKAYKWTRVALLYSEGVTGLLVSAGIEQNLKGVPGFEVAFTSPIKFYDFFIPLQEVRQSLARVIFLL